MRVGYNPHKDKPLTASGFYHQVIIPVFIPAADGYFKDALTILEYNLESLFRTAHAGTFITIVNNGSSHATREYLDDLHRNGKIQELVHTTNCGKLNAILKGIAGNKFDLVTISDSDVLFTNGWQTATYDVFESFPKTGAVCPTPSSKSFRTHTANIWAELLFSKKLQFRNVHDSEALKAFGHSVGNAYFYSEHHLSRYLTVASNASEAVVGAGHFVTTYRGDVFDGIKKRYSEFALGGTSEKELLDLPVVKKGYWRLSTAKNFTWHMGNTLEDWMPQMFAEIQKDSSEVKKPDLAKPPIAGIVYKLKYKLFSKALSHKPTLRKLLHFKGLSKTAAKNYHQ